MVKVLSGQTVRYMSKNNQFIDRIDEGEIICFETNDCFFNLIQSEDDTASTIPNEKFNPATGPLYINGAQKGDILKIEIMKIDLAEKGVIASFPENEALGKLLPDEKFKIVEVKNNEVRFNDEISFEIEPMIGVIGVAPEQDDIITSSPGTHGGNMDCRKIGEGAILYLPVYVDGALLAMGDLHARMGDGEISGCGIEIAGKVTIKVDIIRNKDCRLPLLKTNDEIIAIASAKSVDAACIMATENMFHLLVHHAGMEKYEAGLLLSAIGNLSVCQIVNPLKTVRMGLPLSIFKQCELF